MTLTDHRCVAGKAGDCLGDHRSMKRRDEVELDAYQRLFVAAAVAVIASVHGDGGNGVSSSRRFGRRYP